MSRPCVLVADDQQDVLEALRILLKSEGFDAHCVSSPKEILEAVKGREFDALLMDLNYTRDTTSGREGLDLMDHLKAMDEELPVVVMTAWGSVEVAVEAMQRGAGDFVEKPWENRRLLSVLRTQVELGKGRRRRQILEEENRLLRRQSQPVMIAASPAMAPVRELIERVGPADANVLITGQNGAGKGVVARALHGASRRALKPMVSVNAGALAAGVFESELFGHVKGAFTDAKRDRVGRFDMADGGTLFLDEIANISLGQQAKLLRVLETGEFERIGSSRTRKVDVRIISATNADLRKAVEEGRFRQDLLYRLNTIEIPLPRLAARGDDILLLASHFLERHGFRYGKELAGFDAVAEQALLSHDWPGNVRELDHAVERAVLMSVGEVVRAVDLGLQGGEDDRLGELEEMTLEEVEGLLVKKALQRHNGNVMQAAAALGLSRSALYRRLERHGL